MRSRRPARTLGVLLTGRPGFLVAGLIDLACVLPAALRYLWRPRRGR
jgi:hypothetical protein